MRLAGAVRTQHTDPFAVVDLGVERSLTDQRWTDRLGIGNSAAALVMAQVNGIPDVVARVLAGRGVSAADASAFQVVAGQPSTQSAHFSTLSFAPQGMIGTEEVEFFGEPSISLSE